MVKYTLQPKHSTIQKLSSILQNINRLKLDQWGILDVLISNKSPIDLTRLAITDPQDAYDFILNYGYDLGQKDQADEVQKIQNEAVEFIQTYLIDTLPIQERRQLEIPPTISRTGPIELLLLASSSPRAPLQRWACAVLRIMHTMAHVASDLSVHYFPSILQQILSPYDQHIRNKKGKLILGQDPNFQIELVDFHVKAGKDRHSAILKLLHKPENVATDIFDRIGVRFVTQDRLDALLIIKYLREKNLVTFPNVKPSRSINTLIKVDKFKRTFKSLYKDFEEAKITLEEFDAKLRHSAQFIDTLTGRQINHLFNRNPHTHHQYSSIQFTVRQQVQIENPLYAYRKYIDTEKLPNTMMKENLKHISPAYRFFFPYEIQIVDIETHENNSQGQASYNTYKNRKVIAARQRIMGGLLKQLQPQKT